MSQTSNNEVEIAWTPDEHCPVLDGVRGLAILSVTLYRLCKELDADAHAMLASVRRFAPIGERGVDLFFVLSGFLITGILLRTKSKRYYFRNFIFRRSLRIFPLYFVSLFLGLLVLPKLISTHAFDLARREQAFLWTYTSNLRMSWLNEWCFGPFDHFWSLAVEEHFYFVWPAVVLFLTRKQLGILCIGIVVCVGLLRTIAATNSRFEVAVSVATYFRADALCLGAWLAVFLTSSVSRLTIRRVAWISIGLLLPALMVVAFTGKRLLGIPNSLCPMLCTAGMALLLLSSRKSLTLRLRS